MKKLNKNLNVKKETIEAYNVYFDCSCDCMSSCGNDSSVVYKPYKRTQSHNYEYQS